MLKFFKELNKSIKIADKITAENKFMSNPFNKVVNQTFVWTEKPLLLKNIFKK